MVEERRAYLRGRHEDLLVELADRYVALGDGTRAFARFRQALKLNPDSARARAGIARLGSVVETGPV